MSRWRTKTCLALLLLWGCARPAARDPLGVARRYLDLAAEGQLDAAYAMLSDDYKRRCDRPCFVKLLSSQRPELLQARAQVRAKEARAELRAELALSDGTFLKLAQPAGGGPYAFADNPLDFYPQDTPERTLRSFMRAVESRRYEPLLRFVPQALEAQYTLEVLRERFDGAGRTALLAELAVIRRHLGEPFMLDREGRTARLPVGDGKEAQLTFEDGRWRVERLE